VNPVIREFIEHYNYQKIAIIEPDQYRFKRLRGLLNTHRMWDIVWFRDGVERLDLQIKFAESLSCLIFMDYTGSIPPIPARLRAFIVESIDSDLIMMTDDTGIIDYSRRFLVREIHV
jgi:hypothetical protein